MTFHARKRLEERFHLSQSQFNDYYITAMKNKDFFKKPFQGAGENGISVCIKANKIMIVVVLDKRNGRIITIMNPKIDDYLKAIELGWKLYFPTFVYEFLMTRED